MTVDPTHAAAADDWDQHWDQYSAAASNNPAQRFRHRLALRVLEEDVRPERLLDLGSGQGDLLLAASRRWPGTSLAGVEPSAVGIAESRHKVPNARFTDADVSREKPIPEAFAAWATHAVCSEVLEHVDDDIGLLHGARRLMAPGCRLVVTVPGGPMSAFDHHIGHRRHYTPDSLGETLSEAGYRVEWTAGAGYPFFNVYRRVVIARGDKLADDVTAAQASGRPAAPARAAMLAFRPLLRATLTRSRRGWQIVGVATRA